MKKRLSLEKERRSENIIYLVLWIIAAGIYLLDEARARSSVGMPMLDLGTVLRMIQTIFPYFLLFIINNAILIPRLLLKNRTVKYVIAVTIAVLVVWAYLVFSFTLRVPPLHGHVPSSAVGINAHPLPHRPDVHRLLPLPLALDFTYALLVIGLNMAIALMFQSFKDKLERESLHKANAESELEYLKMQINPHFYMNMLNNIHGLIEIDPLKAQEMLLDMSQLMRYMLYDSSQPRISLSSEIAFVENYLRLMRQRYPASRVQIRSKMPAAREVAGLKVPPLLTLVFIENSFKHGISYRENSFVDIDLRVEDKILKFVCKNSLHKDTSADCETGIGLKNVTHRLNLIYGENATLKIQKSNDIFSITLIIPVNETTHSCD